jgi:hypothetical protein
VKDSGRNAAVFPFTGYSPADKPKWFGVAFQIVVMKFGGVDRENKSEKTCSCIPEGVSGRHSLESFSLYKVIHRIID